MSDIDILQSILNGNHLSDDELNRANDLVYLIKKEVMRRS